jgi:hypothetical protein
MSALSFLVVPSCRTGPMHQAMHLGRPAPGGGCVVSPQRAAWSRRRPWCRRAARGSRNAKRRGGRGPKRAGGDARRHGEVPHCGGQRGPTSAGAGQSPLLVRVARNMRQTAAPPPTRARPPRPSLAGFLRPVAANHPSTSPQAKYWGGGEALAPQFWPSLNPPPRLHHPRGSGHRDDRERRDQIRSDGLQPHVDRCLVIQANRRYHSLRARCLSSRPRSP